MIKYLAPFNLLILAINVLFIHGDIKDFFYISSVLLLVLSIIFFIFNKSKINCNESFKLGRIKVECHSF